MPTVFDDYVDDMVPSFTASDFEQYDLELFHGEEEDDRQTLFYKNVARQFKGYMDEFMHFRERDTFRMRQLKRDLAGICDQLDDSNSQLKKESARTRVLEKDNEELTEQLKKECSRNRMFLVALVVVVRNQGDLVQLLS